MGPLVLLPLPLPQFACAGRSEGKRGGPDALKVTRVSAFSSNGWRKIEDRALDIETGVCALES